ncbi:MAG: hypothetical protein PHW13_10970 [Methylococcales bacterium]|nr:hypothetical protein [Methylococcales bacterium]
MKIEIRHATLQDFGNIMELVARSTRALQSAYDTKTVIDTALELICDRRNDQSIQDIANDVNICLPILKTWLKKAKLNSSRDRQTKLKRPQDWRLYYFSCFLCCARLALR